MNRPQRTTPSIFPDTFDGMLAKAKTLVRECPDRSSWRCVLGFVGYKLAPRGGPVQEDVIDALVAWIAEQREQLEATGRCDEDFENTTADDLARLIRLIAEHLEEADA